MVDLFKNNAEIEVRYMTRNNAISGPVFKQALLDLNQALYSIPALLKNIFFCRRN